MQLIAREESDFENTKTVDHQSQISKVLILDNDESVSGILAGIVRRRFDKISIVPCKDGNHAMDELLLADPVLFITDAAHAQLGDCILLAWIESRQASFPILVIAGDATEGEMMGRFPSTLNLHVLSKPLSPIAIETYLSAVNPSNSEINSPHHSSF